MTTSDIEWISPRYIQEKGPHEKDRGTWERVFQYLRAGDYRETLQFPGYLVVQVDTDVSTHVNFGVAHQEPATGQKRTPEELVTAVRERLKREMAAGDWELVGARLLFAIGVHETQCWLTPLVADGVRQKAITGCDHAVQQGISDRNLRREFGLKEVRAYDVVSSPFRKKKELAAATRKQRSLAMFLEELGRVELDK